MQDTIVVRPRQDPDARLRLICLGFCGGGAGSYMPWADVLPEGVELAAICYPGREGRFAEDCPDNWDELAEDAVAAVLSAADRDYVLFGHSMGGWMAFDVAARIEERGGPLPKALVVSSANAPSRGLTVQDMFPAQRDTDEQIMHWMETFGLLPQHVLDDPDLREMALDLMRADVRIRDTFYYRDGAQVSVPVQVINGDADEVIDPRAAEQWRDLAAGEYRHDVLPGGHFYTPETWGSLPTRIPALYETAPAATAPATAAPALAA
ncbi:alpha/beta fold hydrolase [Streptomyces sp. SR27]|uniref:thioesterase II family protein n=1 Tax=unclassified Streptomyces TaxID=2593676 RepID=UPI00295A58F7|nr:alpha/beta fold hydrolase [Streptomyces sp. SR27]MDV9187876.1 alpha/beta fold hydrolase [Streptomyces sp. SR27]